MMVDDLIVRFGDTMVKYGEVIVRVVHGDHDHDSDEG